MLNKKRYTTAILAAVVLLLSPVFLLSCASGHRAGVADNGGATIINDEKTDSADFVPLHPPVVVPHTWRE